jgi:hypothetical protein
MSDQSPTVSHEYSIFDMCIQEPLAYARGTATATVRERLNTQSEIALIARRCLPAVIRLSLKTALMIIRMQAINPMTVRRHTNPVFVWTLKETS